MYDVEFPDGDVREYSANIIAENMSAQVDFEGFTHRLLDHISDYKKDDNTVDKVDSYVATKRGRKRLRKSTNEWHMKVEWKAGSSQWVPLKTLNVSNPIETAEFAVAREIQDEPAFAW